MRRASCRASGPQHLICITVRYRHWPSCSSRQHSARHNSALVRNTTSKTWVLLLLKMGQVHLVLPPIAMTSIRETADAVMSSARA